MRLVTLGAGRYMQHSVLASDSPTGVSLSTLHTSLLIPTQLLQLSATLHSILPKLQPALCYAWSKILLLRDNENKCPFVYVCVSAISTKRFNRF